MKNDATQSDANDPDPSFERLVDRMVDGELTSDEQRNLLLTCEEEDRWRELALVYVESQVMGNVLSDPALLNTPNPRPSTQQNSQQNRNNILETNLANVGT